MGKHSVCAGWLTADTTAIRFYLLDVFLECESAPSCCENMIDHVIKTSSLIDAAIFHEGVWPCRLWQSYFIWRLKKKKKKKKKLDFCLQNSAETCKFPLQSQWYAMGFCCFLMCRDWGTIHTVPWDGFVMHLIIYILLGRLSAKGPRGICWVN